MKTAMKFLICFITAVSIMAFTSCSKDEIQGPIGPQGQQGEQGIQGQDGEEGQAGQDGEALGVPGPQGPAGAAGADGVNGANGAPGADGAQGADGADGAPGADGNANVQNYVIDVSNFTGSTINRTISAITQDAIDNDMIIGYLKSDGREYAPVPAPRYLLPSGEVDVAVDLRLGIFQVTFYQVGSSSMAMVNEGELDKLRVVIAKSTSTTSGKSGKDTIKSDMKAKGVDVNNYYDVMDYFGLDY